MELEKKRIKISIGGITVEAELKATRTANGIYEALPIETALNQWGEEFYEMCILRPLGIRPVWRGFAVNPRN